MFANLTGPGGLDFVVLVDPAGKVLCRSGGKSAGDDLSADPLVAAALGQRRTASGTVALSRQRLAAEGADLAERAAIAVVPTEAAARRRPA